MRESGEVAAILEKVAKKTPAFALTQLVSAAKRDTFGKIKGPPNPPTRKPPFQSAIEDGRQDVTDLPDGRLPEDLFGLAVMGVAPCLKIDRIAGPGLHFGGLLST